MIKRAAKKRRPADPVKKKKIVAKRTVRNPARLKAKNISAAEWLSVRAMLKRGATPKEIEEKYAIPATKIYAKQRIWRFEDYKKNPIYQNPKYIAWRLFCLKRDNYTCRHCGKSKATNPKTIFQVDHIHPFSQFPELRYDVTNGRTLCLSCHKKTPTWGRKALNYKKKK